MGEKYKYTQVGIVTIIMMLLAAAFTTFLFYSAIKSAEGGDAVILQVTGLIVAGVFVLALAAFYSFSIQIADGKLNFWFGFGVAKRSFPVDEVQSAEIVKTPWYYFWGIKSIPGGLLYSIAPGGQAIEVNFIDNRKIRLGTNHPEDLKKRLDEIIVRIG